MKILLCHPQTQHSHKVAKLLYKNDLLLKFVNSFVLSKSYASHLPDRIQQLLVNRIIDIPQEQLASIFSLELRRVFYQKVLKENTVDNYFSINRQFQNEIPSSLIKRSDVVVGYDSSSWILAERAKKLSKVFVLERTISHHNLSKSIYKESQDLYPNWRREIKFDMSHEYIKQDDIELERADIVTVGSNFVKASLVENGTPPNKIAVNPYGINTQYFKPFPLQLFGKIRFLFFGTISPRKGIPTLLNAWKKLAPANATLTIAGYGSLPSHVELPPNVEFLGKIDPSKRNELFNNAHVFVFPSLLEGFAQVLIEAAACGLPLITTYNAGGMEIVEEGVNGFLIKPNDEDALVDRLKYFIDNPEMIHLMGKSKLAWIRSNFSLESYEERWLTLLGSIR